MENHRKEKSDIDQGSGIPYDTLWICLKSNDKVLSSEINIGKIRKGTRVRDNSDVSGCVLWSFNQTQHKNVLKSGNIMRARVYELSQH